MPKRDGSPTRGELRAERRAQRDAQNSGLDYAQRRLLIRDGHNEHNATQIERSATTHVNRHLQGVRDKIALLDQRRAAQRQASIEDGARDGQTDDDASGQRDANEQQRDGNSDDANKHNGRGAKPERDRNSDGSGHNARASRRAFRPPPPPPESTDSADFESTPQVSSLKTYIAPQESPIPPGMPKLPGVDDAGDIRWVMEHLYEEGAEKDAPSRTALSWMLFARSGDNARQTFMRDVFGKVFVSRNAEEQERRERKRLAEIGEMVERCLGMRLRLEEELCEPEWRAVDGG